MNARAKTATITAGLALMAAPAFAAGQQPASTPPGYNAGDNPGIANQPTSTPPGYNGQNNPGSSHAPTRAEARALGRSECQEFKTNFKENRSAFGRCIAAVASALRSDATPAQACKDKRLSRTRHDGQSRSDFRACVLAASRAEHEQSQGS